MERDSCADQNVRQRKESSIAWWSEFHRVWRQPIQAVPIEASTISVACDNHT